MSKGHVIWQSHPGTKFCVCDGLDGVPEQYQISQGISRAAGFPKDARFAMDRSFPKQVALPDCLSNADDMVVVSAKLEELLAGRGVRSVEYLPVGIVNHKGRRAKEPYFIVNPLVIVDCIDQAASDLQWNAIDPSSIASAGKLALDPARIPADLQLFRPKFMTELVVLRRDLADAVKAGGFTGLRFVEIDEYPY